jgi:hypothetical protein
MTARFVDIVKNGQLTGESGMRGKGASRAISWYRTLAQTSNSKTDRSIQGRTTNNPQVGSLYMFVYDAKHKATLPHYDAFPLVFPIEPAEGGFLGLNLHYLPPTLRAMLMDRLMDFASDQRFDENTILKANYQVLKSTAKLKMYKPCLKRYLLDHTRSNFLKVYSAEWQLAALLPLANFKKQTQEQVWEMSRQSAK